MTEENGIGRIKIKEGQTIELEYGIPQLPKTKLKKTIEIKKTIEKHIEKRVK